MEGLGESEGKAAMFAFQKMSALCLGGGCRVVLVPGRGLVWGSLHAVRPWRELGGARGWSSSAAGAEGSVHGVRASPRMVGAAAGGTGAVPCCSDSAPCFLLLLECRTGQGSMPGLTQSGRAGGTPGFGGHSVGSRVGGGSRALGAAAAQG